MIEIIGEEEINLDTLYAQYNPSRNRYYKLVSKSMLIKDSPHVDFLRQYEHNKDFKYSKTNYYKMHQLYGKKHPWINQKCGKFLTLYNRIKEGKEVDKIIALKNENKYEIYEGHHRASCFILIKRSIIILDIGVLK